MRDDQFANLVRLGNIHVDSSEMFLGGDYIQQDRLPFTGARGDDLGDHRDRPELRRSEQEDLQRLSHLRLSFTQQVRLPWDFLNAYFNNTFFLDRDADLDIPGWRERETDHPPVRHSGAAHPRRERPRAPLHPPGPEHHLTRQSDLSQSQQLSSINYCL